MSALLWLAATLALYAAARAAQRRAGGHPLLNPVLLAAAPLMGALWWSGASYADYAQGGDVLLWLLGPATVALAIPAYDRRAELRRAAAPLMAAILAGSVTAVASVVGLAWAAGVDARTLRSLAPKSVTTAIAWPLATGLGGEPGITALSVIVTGVLGALMAGPICRALGMRDPRALGAALGTTAHGIGTARALQLDPLAGLFAGLAMAINGALTALLLPLLARLLGW